MIGENITIEGLERLFSIFPRDFAFEGAYLKGVLLHENGVIQLTYSIIDKANDKTYLFVFICSECKCKDDYKLQVPTNRNSVSELNIRYADDKHKDLCFLDTTNGITITCQNMKIDTYVILSKANAKHQAHKLTHDYFEEIQKKFNDFCLLKPLSNGEPLFRRDDSYNGIPASHHSMYKLRDLHNKDNSIVYEFLIEFDRNDPCLGIYYGCKALIKKGDSNEQQAIISNEWNKNIKPGVQRRLDNIFPGKKFGYRFKPTDNANDNTFWPFWISLYADENILEVAVRATIIIRDEYKRYLEGEEL